MDYFLRIIIFIQTATSFTLLRLSTNDHSRLVPGDLIYSTLGQFRMSLIPQTCSLQVEQFKQKEYVLKGNFTNSERISCEYLNLGQGILQTPNGINILKIESADISVIKKTTLTIDDLGIIRIIGTGAERISKIVGLQVRVTIFRQPKNLIYSTSDISISSKTPLSFRQNKRGWGLSAVKGQLRIFNIRNTSRVAHYRYQGFTITPAQIVDKKNNEPPSADFKGFKYPPRCGFLRTMEYEAPYTFEMDQYWPQLRILEQGGYELFSIRYPNFRCIDDLGYHSLIDMENCMSWFCPPETFEYKGGCQTQCPGQYYHQIKQNGKNKCVLSCQQGSTVVIHNNLKICTCQEKLHVPKCSEQTDNIAINYPLGCICKHNKFYLKHFGCLKVCPPGYFAHGDGVCVSCPFNCQMCEKTDHLNQAINYLVCKQCRQGYQLYEGLCRKKSFNKSTLQCKTDFCLQCVKNSTNKCQVCAKPFILFEKSCIRNCPTGYFTKMMQSISGDDQFVCQKIQNCSETAQISSKRVQQCRQCKLSADFCWKRCDGLKFFNNRSQCFCKISNSKEMALVSNKYGFVQNCLKPTQIMDCLYKQFLYSETQECLPCPFGCLSCQHDEDGFIQCTSCAPSYFLNLNVNFGHFCQLDTSLVGCDFNKRYEPSIKVCVQKDDKNYQKIQTRKMCLKQITNCILCAQKSQNKCTFCQQGFFLYKGSCLQNCPGGTLEYNRVCLIYRQSNQTTHDNCEILQVVQYNHLINIDIESQFMEGYNYFLPKSQIGVLRRIDPIGKPYMYLTYFVGNIEGSREASYDQGIIQCKKCMPFYGKNSITGQCALCKQSKACLKCATSQSEQCLECHSHYELNQDNICIEKKDQNKYCENQHFRLQNRKCTPTCSGFYNGLKESINCTNACMSIPQKAQKPVEYLICPQLKGENKISDTTLYLAGNYYALGKNSIFFLIPVQSQFIAEPLEGIQCHYRFGQNYQNQSSCSSLTKGRGLQQESPFNSFLHATKQKVLVLFNKLSSPSFLNIGLKPGVMTPSAPFLTNSQFYFTEETPKYHESLSWGLAIYGNIYVVLLFILTILFLADHLNYKTDNLFILMQTLPLFLYSLNLKQASTKDYYRFYYGYRWSIGHIFGSPHNIPLTNSLNLPYIENSSNNAHHLINIDNNVIRNTGVLLIIVVSCAFICGVLWLIMKKLTMMASKSSKSYGKADVDHCEQVKLFFIFILEQSMLVFAYYSISNLLNDQWVPSQDILHSVSVIISIIFVSVIFLYSIFRFTLNRIGGFYMFKRCYLAIILSFIRGNSIIMFAAIGAETCFTFLRLYFEIIQFKRSVLRQKNIILMLFAEQFMIMLCYAFLGLVDVEGYNAHGVTILILWIVINILMLMLLTEIVEYLIRLVKKHEFDDYMKDIKERYIQKIRKGWDYQNINNSTQQSLDKNRSINKNYLSFEC